MDNTIHPTVMRLAVALVVGLLAAILPSGLSGGETEQISRETSTTSIPVGLTARRGRLSLQAQDTSLKGIFEAIGRQLHIEVVTRIPADERVTLAFDQLSLIEALKRFRPYVNYLVLEDSAEKSGTIRKLIVVSKRVADMPDRPAAQGGDAWAPPEPQQSRAPTTAAPARPKPFTFRFDPSAVRERGR